MFLYIFVKAESEKEMRPGHQSEWSSGLRRVTRMKKVCGYNFSSTFFYHFYSCLKLTDVVLAVLGKLFFAVIDIILALFIRI